MWNTTVKAALDNSLLTTPAGEELSTSESWCVWICAGRKKIEIDTKNSIGRERVTHHMPKCPQVSHKPPFVALLGKGNLAFQRTLHAESKRYTSENATSRLFRLCMLEKTILEPDYVLGSSKMKQNSWGFLLKPTTYQTRPAWSPCTSMARPKSASLTAAFLHLLPRAGSPAGGEIRDALILLLNQNLIHVTF